MTIEYSIKIQSSPTRVFNVYKDVTSWAQWDPDIEAVELEGEFAAGTKGWLKPVGAPKTATRMISVDEPHAFVVESKLPLCTMRFEHELKAQDDQTVATHRVLFIGPLSSVFSWIIGGKINKGIAGTMQGLKQYVENL